MELARVSWAVVATTDQGRPVVVLKGPVNAAPRQTSPAAEFAALNALVQVATAQVVPVADYSGTVNAVRAPARDRLHRGR
eukprot:4007481-Lingulodinium_polyedra.AAC.1